jgi:hypothetical protein
VEERERLEEAIQNNSTKTTALQNKVKRSNIDVGVDLFCQINDAIKKFDYSFTQITVVQAEFQADSLLAGSLNNKDADLVLSADSDLAALVGPKCFGIKSFRFIDLL